MSIRRTTKGPTTLSQAMAAAIGSIRTQLRKAFRITIQRQIELQGFFIKMRIAPTVQLCVAKRVKTHPRRPYSASTQRVSHCFMRCNSLLRTPQRQRYPSKPERTVSHIDQIRLKVHMATKAICLTQVMSIVFSGMQSN